MFDSLRDLVRNYVLSAAIFSWFFAQVLKVIFTFMLTKKLRVERLFGAGGMPSAHSAMVCSLAIAVSRVCGVNSPEFALAFVFACVVMYDAMGIRRQAGKHAQAINKLMDIVEDENEEDELGGEENDKELKELIGHTPLQVLSGALLGILVALILPFVF